MKVDYLIEFLPPELRRKSVLRASRRRNSLLVSLMILLAVGVAAHSWNLYRKADIDRQVSMQVCTNSAKVDDFVIKLAGEQQAITRFMGVYDQISNPLDTSDLIASLTHLMPEKMSLAMIKFESEGGIAAASNPGDSGSAAGSKPPPVKPARPAPVQNPKGDKNAKPAAPEIPKRWLNATIRGYAASNADLYDFVQLLSRTKPLEEVTVTQNKPTEVPGSNLQEFTISCRIPLNARYQLSSRTTAGPAVPAVPELIPGSHP
ncbi:MAG: PilN domain-containing protein [Phycisphaerae bacterium]|nr:PilN domain-containing protein [Phycisphaerae bacterium]